MNLWYAKAVVLATSVAIALIRAPHGNRSRKVRVVKSGRGPRETMLLTLAWLGFFLPLVWVFSPWLAFADYRLRPAPLITGIVLIVPGLWLFYRSHADLGTNWSMTLEVREGHTLVTQGVYRSIRHPMYSALFLLSIGLAFALPNVIAGPAYLVTYGLLFALRIGREEAMMREEFGKDYESYAARTRRLIPGVW
jgi:protein-S-isoprenylcysteine O-methyltransferase Ste14